MMHHLRFAALMLSVMAIIVACEEHVEVDQRLIDTYTEVVIARESTLDTVRAQADVRATLQRHGYTTEDFERELADIGTDPAKFRMLYDSVAKRLTARRDSAATR